MQPGARPEVRSEPIEYTVYGHSLRHDPAKRYGEEIIALLNRVWPVVKGEGIAHDGINRVVYEADGTVFAGVVLTGGPDVPGAVGLERKAVRLTRYAVWKHVGPYHLLHATCSAMEKALAAQGVKTGWPMVEVYGHWTNDESKLETETFVAVL